MTRPPDPAEAAETRRGLLIILSSPSGAGKSTLSRRLLEFDTGIDFSVSATTRAPRPGEREGREYFFKSRREFETMVAQGEMPDHAAVLGHPSGARRPPPRGLRPAPRVAPRLPRSHSLRTATLTHREQTHSQPAAPSVQLFAARAARRRSGPPRY